MKALRTKRLAGFCIILGMYFLSSATIWAEEPKTVKLGTLFPLTGPLSILGINAKNGCEMAAGEINEAGGIKSLGGAKIEFVHGDTEGKGQTGMSVAERLIKQDGVSVCFSGPQSGVTIATTQISEKYGIPHLVTGSIADAITGRGFKYVFRIVSTASKYSVEHFRFIEAMEKQSGLKVKTIGFLYENTEWGQSQIKAWAQNKGNRTIVADFPYAHGTSDITVTIAKLKAANPDVVMTCSYVSDAILITKTMFELDFNCQGILSSGAGPEDPLYYKNLKELTEYVTTASLFSDHLPGPYAKVKSEKYEKLYKAHMADHSSLGYAGTYIVADVLERAASADPKKIREAFARTNLCKGPAMIVPIKCMTFDETGQAPTGPIQVQWQKGILMPVFPPEYAAAPCVWPMPTWKERGLKK
jgi:branched-chain amino acid transport system substrate-binding protein